MQNYQLIFCNFLRIIFLKTQNYLPLLLNTPFHLAKIKGALSGLKQVLATESPLKIMKNAFYFTSKALFVLQIFKLLSRLFGHAAKRLDKKD